MTAQPIVCSSCHTPLPESAAFCWVCGTATPTGVNTQGVTVTRSSLESAAALKDTKTRLEAALGTNFRVEELVGRGGFAEVFAVHDLRLKRDLAVKVLSPELVVNRTMLTRFQREAEAVAALRHPGIVPIYDLGESGGIAYIMMPLIKGETLRKKLDSVDRLRIDTACRILRELADALRMAHDAGLVHRDIKPENVMLDGPREQVLLMDFGIAKAIDPDATGMTTSGLIVGTPHYMSPEQASGDVIDARSDQYSLAVMGYRMLTGSHPFEAETTRALLYKQVFESAPTAAERCPDIPIALSGALQRGMSKDASERFPGIEEFAAAVSAGASGEPAGTSPLAHTRATPSVSRQGQPPIAKAAKAAKAVAQSTSESAAKVGQQVRSKLSTARVTRRTAAIAGVSLLAVVAIVVALTLGGGGGANPAESTLGAAVPETPSPEGTTPEGGETQAPTTSGTGNQRTASNAPAPAREPAAAPSPRTPAAAVITTCSQAMRRSAWTDAVTLCRPEADAGSVEAQLALAGLYQRGQGTAADPIAAAELYEKAAAGGSADAAFQLGQLLEEGVGVNRDLARASDLYLQAARRGVVPAMSAIARQLEIGAGVGKDVREAVNWYRRAGAAGDAVAQIRLGQMYLEGRGVPKDEVEAVRWFTRGAEAGNAPAQYELALAYFAGRGVARSDSLGMVWLERAAARGSTRAAQELAKRKP